MNRKGFSLFEVIIVLGVLAISATLVVPTFVNGMELQTLMSSDDATVVKIAKAMRYDPHQTVTVIVYSKTWYPSDLDKIDEFMDKRDQVVKRLVNLGIYKHRIMTLLANESGLIGDITPTPAAEGVYIYLD